MGEIGLSQERIIEMLKEKGIEAGQLQSAGKLRDAIADVIRENNMELEKKIGDMISEGFANELRKYKARHY